MTTLRHLVVLAIITGILHLVWEMAHIGLYTGYAALEGALPVWVIATLGDVAYTIIAVLLVTLFKGDSLWFQRPGARDYLGLSIVGFTIALLVEYKALALGRWAYTAAMPLIPFLHVGLSPILQMMILLPVSVYLSRLFYTLSDVFCVGNSIPRCL